MAKRVTLHKDFVLRAKEVEKAFANQADSRLKGLIRHILICLEDAAHVYGSTRRYATGNYAKSFRFSVGSVHKNKDYSFFGGAGYGLDGIPRLSFRKMKQSRFISFYNIAGKKHNGTIFHYAGLVDKYGWTRWHINEESDASYHYTPPWRIMDIVFARITTDPVWGPLLSNANTTTPGDW